MSKYEVIVTVWSREENRQIQIVGGTFTDYMCAKLFADSYKNHYSANAEIVEYIRK